MFCGCSNNFIRGALAEIGVQVANDIQMPVRSSSAASFRAILVQPLDCIHKAFASSTIHGCSSAAFIAIFVQPPDD
ncbi:hypothetical protein PF010_g21564 [Phytophthora fragariae]|uniref:Uncharacterized protein n=1 Tax=Phytophthora fragariae TaxID=53985 RepID=A0A6A3IRE3_9STRA|nr:hypothetical protein PF003_g3873 [Phytophthora fragariae]KAE8984640.1 hypothetical protein PF011_g20701 [Phytophthora fragariae]KAE9082492.1 hypothetical protein PF010_g21564 [Phytophthora fragariae]KAE9194326.1 hypothetical protein PF004_g20753 [Phytophthora fragariae]KAE9251319.1 hypothetical protein PF002_g4356 [Phytophthora fragariae]